VILLVAIMVLLAAAALAGAAEDAAGQADQRAREAQRRTRELEHLAYVGTLTGGLAHEIRNPLSTLTLNLQLLREDLDRPGAETDPRILRRLDTLEQEVKHLQQILDDFLRFAGKYEVHLTVQPLNPVLEDLAAFYQERLQRASIQVRTTFAEGLPEVAFDAPRLKQAVSNLILNAEAAMPQGGDLMIRTEADPHGIRLHVTDTGVGIAPEDMDRIFDPYYSTRPGGTGLGLPTVRRIVQEHGGALEVHSEVGRGTRFTIHLPAADGGHGAPRTGAAAGQDRQRRTAHEAGNTAHYA
jgi:signal transduction histidine kinase